MYTYLHGVVCFGGLFAALENRRLCTFPKNLSRELVEGTERGGFYWPALSSSGLTTISAISVSLGRGRGVRSNLVGRTGASFLFIQPTIRGLVEVKLHTSVGIQ